MARANKRALMEKDMKKRHFVIIGVVCVMLWSLTNFQSAQVQPFDLKKCQQELEIMKGILRTTLGFASQELATGLKSDKVERAKRFVFGRSGDFNIGAFYLVGQGAVFTIPTSSVRDMMRARKGPMALAIADSDFRFNWNGGFEDEMAQLENQLNELNAQLQDSFGLDELPALAAVPAPPSPPAPAAPAVSPAAPAPAPKPPQPAQAKEGREGATAREKQLRQKLAEMQEKVKQRGAEEDARQAKFRESLSQLKVFLIEAMANHGDSLTVVKPTEYVNLVIVDEGNRWFGFGDDSGDRAQREVLSVQKSAITDYKTGKLSMEAFKQKVLNYVN
jgi:hypothetical protein